MSINHASPIWLRILKILGKTLLGLVLFVIVYIGAAYVLSHISVARESDTKDEVAIYLRTNGVHTDLVLPVKSDAINWGNEMPFENTVSKDTAMRYIGIGWGDKGFYLETPTWADLKFSTAFKAVFNLSTTAIHATYYKDISANEQCKRIGISKSQYTRLIYYIKNCFQTDAAGRNMYIKTNANYGPYDAFYEAKGGYNLFHTCNTWTNNGLKSCGQKACLWTPFQGGLFYQYQ